MSKYYMIIAHDGTQVIDYTPEAENRLAAMKYQEERAARERRRKSNRKRKPAQNPLYRLARLCCLV